MNERSIIVKTLSPVKEFIKDSRAAGVVLISCTVISLIISNSAWSETYLSFWSRELNTPAPRVHLPSSIFHIINDGLMAFFFLLAGMEIKRELLVGELSDIKKAMLPIFAAFGGMLVPAVLYIAWCGGTIYSRGWGIPMATDIAFSLGVLSLLGKKAPLSLRIFLMALAIIDDLGGILTIAFFYTGEIKTIYLFLGGGMVFVLAMMNLLKVKGYYLYFLFGIALWYFIFNSGVHAAIAGVLLAITLPLHKINELEHIMHDPVNFIILPLFALANTAIVLPADLSRVFISTLHQGVFTGLVIGKPVGIFLFSLLAIKLKLADLPGNMTLRQLWGIGMIAGIGFTISIFMTTLAFKDLDDIQVISKVAIIGASVVSGMLGYLWLSKNKKRMQ
jgi:NhaA family Na+:H+ antiporter